MSGAAHLRHLDVSTNEELVQSGMEPWAELEEGERIVSVETLPLAPGFVTFRVWIECAE